MATNKKCSCGNNLPYRRALNCKECWTKLGPDRQDLLMTKRATRHQGGGSLSLRGGK